MSLRRILIGAGLLGMMSLQGCSKNETPAPAPNSSPQATADAMLNNPNIPEADKAKIRETMAKRNGGAAAPATETPAPAGGAGH